MNSQVLEIIKNSAAIPSVPQVVTRVLQIMQDPYFDYGDIVKALSADAGTVSEILRLSNSALFGVRQKVVSLRQALTLLGPKRTRSLLLGRYLVQSMGSRTIQGLEMTYFWRRSLSSAVVASHVANRIAPKQRDEAFISALLADVGVAILTQAMPERYRPIYTQYTTNGATPTPEEELEAIGVTHGEVSAMVLGHWGLPEAIVKAVNMQSSDNPGEGEPAVLARIINASDRIAKLLCEIPDVESIRKVCASATAFVGMKVQDLVDMLATVERDIEDLADILRIDVVSSNVYALIAKTVQEQLAQPVAG